MADVGVWTKNADIQAKAGTNANATAKATAATDLYVLEVESFVNCICRHNFSDTYSTLNDDVKHILKSVTTNLMAIIVIQWDMSGFTSNIEAEDMINVLWATVSLNINLLRDQKVVDFINNA